MPISDEKVYYEKILASAVSYLMQGDEDDKEAARILLSGELAAIERIEDHADIFVLCGSRELCEIFPYDRQGSHLGQRIENALTAVVGHWMLIRAQYKLIEVEKDWRARFMLEGERFVNQNVWAKTPEMWNGLSFNSKAEIEVAKALERAGVMYFPNCVARLGAPGSRQVYFPDFLVCYNDRWGIIEVDGPKYHTHTNATQDHERRRVIEQHGNIKFFDRFDARQCMNRADDLVKTFLQILGKK